MNQLSYVFHNFVTKVANLRKITNQLITNELLNKIVANKIWLIALVWPLMAIFPFMTSERTYLVFVVESGGKQGSEALLGGDHFSILTHGVEDLDHPPIARDYERKPVNKPVAHGSHC